MLVIVVMMPEPKFLEARSNSIFISSKNIIRVDWFWNEGIKDSCEMLVERMRLEFMARMAFKIGRVAEDLRVMPLSPTTKT